MDFLVVTYRPDIKLLRHFLASYDLYYASKNALYVVTSHADDELLAEVRLPSNTKLVYREDFPELAGSTAYSQQVYLKLMAHEIVSTEHYCIMDSDFLFVRPIMDDDFFVNGKPVWFYHPWVEGEPPLRWRADSEKFLGQAVEYNYNDVSQWVFKRSIARALASEHNLKAILNTNTILEFLVYGQFAHTRYPDEYRFLQTPSDVAPVVERINQIPPDYLHLDPACRFEQFKQHRCVVFWSHWELADKKMADFFEDSQIEHFGHLRVRADRRPLRPLIDPKALASGDISGIDGVYPDGWVKEALEMSLDVPADVGAVAIDMDVPANAVFPDWRLAVDCSWSDSRPLVQELLAPGSQRVVLPVGSESTFGRSVVRLRFGPGFQGDDAADRREFRARLRGIEFLGAAETAAAGERA